MLSTISAQVIADSVNDDGERITTLVLEYPRFIHSELMTHRKFSRNSASSRAIPIQKMIQQAEDNTAYPSVWGKNQKGMQAREKIGDDAQNQAKKIWETAALAACANAQRLAELGVHKQIANRILEPFIFTKTIVTATDFVNFFNLRRHEDAQPEIKELADQIWYARERSNPKRLKQGAWHKPFCSDHDSAGLCQSIARCARVSYLNHDGQETTPEADLQLTQRLLASGHWSPFEHQATPMPRGTSNNFTGWQQLREIKQNDSNDKFQFVIS